MKLSKAHVRKIRKRYWKDFASIQEIARELGVGVTTLKRFMIEHDIPRRRRGPREGMATHTVLSNVKKRALIRAIQAGKKTQSQLAREYEVSKQWVHVLAKRIRKNESGE